MHILKKTNQIVNTWSGGTTTELMIYPMGSNYKALDFDFRISTAIVEVEVSTFTSLPDVQRYIMSLTDALTLKHSHKTVELKPLESYAFDGGIQTESEGCVQDFNLMTRNGYTGCLSVENVAENLPINVKSFQGIYVLSGTLTCNNQVLEAMDFAWFEEDAQLISQEASHVVMVTLYSPGKH